jgi:hypothetical protein
MVPATAIHTSRCSWVSVRQRLDTALKVPRIAQQGTDFKIRRLRHTSLSR